MRAAPLLAALGALCTGALCPAGAEALANIAGSRYGTQVRADTEYSPTYSAANVADGRLGPGDACWYSADQTPLPCALTFTFAEPADLRRVVLYQAAWTGNMYHTRGFALEVSQDGVAWQRVATGELPDQSLARVEVPLPPVWARALRIVVLTSYNSYQTCGLAEVELWAAGVPRFGAATVELGGKPAPPPSASHCGLSLLCGDDGPQVALTETPPGLIAAVRPGESVRASVEVGVVGAGELVAQVRATAGATRVALSAEGVGRIGHQTCQQAQASLRAGQQAELRLPLPAAVGPVRVELAARGLEGEAAVWWQRFEVISGGRHMPLPVLPTQAREAGPPRALPELREPLQQALIEWDWRLQDGIGTPRLPSTYSRAVELTLQRGEALLRDLADAGVALGPEGERWERLREEWRGRCADGSIERAPGEDLWRRVHALRREIALKNPLADLGPVLFVKQVPGAFSHQLTQYYGRYARPGGGVFVLEAPGRSMRCRELIAGKLPSGSFQHPEVSFEGDRVLFSFCETPAPPEDPIQGHHGRYYHLYQMRADGGDLRRLTDGPFDDFAPRYLPDGRLLFVSTRRLGWHRCGNPGCENYTLTVADADGSGPRSLSHHETQEWDPAVLHDGRIVYTRWDYVDRNAVFFEQLWSTAPDGSRPQSLFGNMTFNPVGIFEAKAIPGSPRIMATAAAHHAMTAGSIILVDVAEGVDGVRPLTRLTPDAPFPESETTVAAVWHQAVAQPYSTPEAQRWPGHCYRSPCPLSESYFLAAYSFDGLIGEPRANLPNLFGLYLVDRFGNKELLYRDLEIASLWPVPLRARPRPRVVPVQRAEDAGPEGVFLLQNVYSGDPPLPRASVRRLRVLQVLPKSTPGIDLPPVGVPRGAPGKQVLGTVPVEADGSAYFRAPAGVPLAFQALDDRGQAVQVMRSLTYLQPGETISCAGCHEPRSTAPAVRALQAARRAPSDLAPAPDGSRPFSYPLLVQPVLDRLCVRCHGAQSPAGNVCLTGAPEGHYTLSYDALAPRVPISDQGSMDAVSVPGRYGARGSKLMQMLLAGHHHVRLAGEDLERLATWMDANALFYGTFDPADQARQQRGERIAGAKLE